MDQQALHERWAQLARDPRSPDYYELNEHGELVVQLVPTPRHQMAVAWVCEQLREQLGGRAFTGLAVDTRNAGIRVPDVAWLPDERIDEALCDGPLRGCPPVIVEVASKGEEEQTAARAAAYVAAGAEDVIVIGPTGQVTHHRRPGGATATRQLRLGPPLRMFA